MKTLHREIRLPEDTAGDVRTIARTLNDAGFECYLVGGSVRDLLLGGNAFDYDFATDALPEKVTGLFRRVVPTGIKHGTVSVLLGARQYEITTYRADGAYADGRHPESVRFSKTLEEDVARRDFTINGIAFDVLKNDLIDYPGGLEDMERKIIRTIGDPLARFGEDGLRPFRACRFAAKLRFVIEESTCAAIGMTLDIAAQVSMERVRDELMKLLEAHEPSIGFEYMRESGLMNVFLPELAACYGLKQNKYHMYDIYYHSLYSTDAAPSGEPIIRLSALLHDLGKVPVRQEGPDGESTFYNHEVVGMRMARRILKRLKFSNEDSAKVTNLVANHMFHYTDEWTDGAVRRFMRKVGLENLDDLIQLRLADRRGNGMRDGIPQPIRELRKRIDKIIEAENAITVRDLEIDGYAIMEEFKVKPGPLIGAILNELLEIVLDHPEVNERAQLVERAREIHGRLKDTDLYMRSNKNNVEDA
ncbi:MAG: HD domain-containing protein [Spirochaetes bacterium]|nr:MAG: HD domain-containing protein [Spirochaetota bacterium]